MSTAKVIIKGEDQLKGPLTQSKKELDVFAKDIQSIGRKIESAFTLTAIIAAVVKLTSALKDCVNEYAEVEKVTLRLDKVWENVGKVTGKTAKQVNDYADSIEKTTYFTKEAVQESAILLASTKQLTDEGFDRALGAAVDLAAALGEDVTSAAQTLAKALEDPASALNRLKSVGVTFTQAEKDQIKALQEANEMYKAQDIILEKIEDRYKDVAKAINDTPAGKLENVKNLLSDIRKTIGQRLIDKISPAIESLYEDLKKLYDLVDPYLDNGLSKNLASQIASFGSYRLREMFNGADYSTPGTTNYNVNQSLLNEIYDNIKKEGLTFEDLEKVLKDYKSVLEGFGGEGSWSFTDFLLDKDSYSMAYANYMGLYSFIENAKVTGRYSKSSPVVDALEDGVDDLDGAVDNLSNTLTGFSSFLSKYIDSTAYQSYEYRKVIEDATNALDVINRYREDIITGDGAEEVAKILGLPLDILPGEILAMADDLELAIDIYTQKLADLNTEVEREAGEFKAFSIKWDPYGLYNPYGGLNGISGPFGSTLKGIGFSDTFSLLRGSNILTGSDILELDKLFNKYSSMSESYQIKLMEENIARFSELIASYVDEDSDLGLYMSEILEGLKEELSIAKASQKGESGKTTTGSSLFHDLGAAIENYEEVREQAIDKVFNDLTSQMGEAGDFVDRLISNMAQFTPILGLIITALHYIIEGLMQEIKGLLDEFVKWGLEPLREIGRMIGQIFTPIFKEIMPSVIASGKVLMNLFQSIARLLTPIVEILMRVIGPILTVLADVLVSIVGTISWAIDWLAYCITWVLNKVSFGWIEQTAKPGSLSDYVSSMMADPTEGYDNVSTTAGVNAAYSGVTNIYLNIYQNGTVVGEDGISQFAAIIRNELADLSYYGR